MQTIRSSREIDAMFRTAKKFEHPLLLALVAPSSEPARGGRVCFVAGRRLGSAVTRNRIKRVLRESVRRIGGLPCGCDAVLVTRSGLAEAKAPEVDAALLYVLARGSQR